MCLGKIWGKIIWGSYIICDCVSCWRKAWLGGWGWGLLSPLNWRGGWNDIPLSKRKMEMRLKYYSWFIKLGIKLGIVQAFWFTGSQNAWPALIFLPFWMVSRILVMVNLHMNMELPPPPKRLTIYGLYTCIVTYREENWTMVIHDFSIEGIPEMDYVVQH